jgi:general secretion pathway protein K
LYDFRQPNVNSARPGVLAALARYDESQQETLSHYLNGTGPYEFQGPRYFQRANEVATVLGAQSLPQGFGAEIQALRIEVTVREVLSVYRLGVVVAPPGGARPVKAVKKEGEEVEETTTAAPAAPATGARAGANEPPPINYPFTLLEIRENDAPVALPAAAEDTP